MNAVFSAFPSDKMSDEFRAALPIALCFTKCGKFVVPCSMRDWRVIADFKEAVRLCAMEPWFKGMINDAKQEHLSDAIEREHGIYIPASKMKSVTKNIQKRLMNSWRTLYDACVVPAVGEDEISRSIWCNGMTAETSPLFVTYELSSKIEAFKRKHPEMFRTVVSKWDAECEKALCDVLESMKAK